MQGTGVQPLNLPARTLHETGSRPYVLEVGGRANTQELLPVVKNGEDVFSIGKFEDWVLISRRLASLIARNVGTFYHPAPIKEFNSLTRTTSTFIYKFRTTGNLNFTQIGSAL